MKHAVVASFLRSSRHIQLRQTTCIPGQLLSGPAPLPAASSNCAFSVLVAAGRRCSYNVTEVLVTTTTSPVDTSRPSAQGVLSAVRTADPVCDAKQESKRRNFLSTVGTISQPCQWIPIVRRESVLVKTFTVLYKFSAETAHAGDDICRA